MAAYILPILTLFYFTAAPSAVIQSEFIRRNILIDSVRREYFIHLPKNADTSKPMPVLFVLHGGGGANEETMARRTNYNTISDREKFVVIYPRGVDGQWNDGRGKTFRRAKDNTSVDDVGFISAIINTLIKERFVDSSRIYLMGMSNGGMMALRIAIEIGNRLAAVAAVIASIPENISNQRPKSPLPVLIMNGTEDPLVPWAGGEVRIFGKKFGTILSTEQTLRYWVNAAGINTEAVIEVLEDSDKNDGCEVEKIIFGAETNSINIVLYKIIGGGHNLPGANTPDRPLLVGNKCMDINGPEEIWNFLKRYWRYDSNFPGSQSEVKRKN